jgi:hypothetical protein
MNPSRPPNRSEIAAISSEALTGLGVTIAALGLLGLLLGWAQHMRSVPAGAALWLSIGAGCVIVGGMIALAARAKRGPRAAATKEDHSS